MRRCLALALALILPAALSGCAFNGIYDLPLPGKKVGNDEGFLVKADFRDALNVVPRSAVMVGDVPVGQVEDIKRVGWHARATMRIRRDVVLPDNVQAQIRQTSLLGEKFVALAPPGDDAGPGAQGRLGPGDVIALDQTSRNPEVEEVLGALSFLLSGGGIEQLGTITHEFNAMMDGRTGKIRDVLEQLNTLVATLDEQKGDIVNALASLNGLSKTLVDERQVIADALDAAGPAIKVLSDQEDELVDALDELDDFSDVGSEVVNGVKKNLIAELRYLRPVLRSLADTKSALVPGLVAALSYPFPIEAADTIKGDYANVVFKLVFNLNPISQGGLLPTNPAELQRLCRALPTAPACPTNGGPGQLCTLLATPLALCGPESTSAAREADAESSSGSSASSGKPKSGQGDLVPKTDNPLVTPQVDQVKDLLNQLSGSVLGSGS